MSWKFWVKFEGSDDPTFQPINTLGVELPIFGIHPSYQPESNNEVSMSGVEIGQRRYRNSLKVDCIPISTWDYGTVTTDNIQYLLRVVLQKKYTRIVAPTAPKKLPDRWTDATHFPYTAGLIPFVFVRNEYTNDEQWASGLEKFTITCYAKDLT